jgi:hypothetical protein
VFAVFKVRVGKEKVRKGGERLKNKMSIFSRNIS